MLVHGGVETLTITDATPGTRVAVHDQEGTPLVTLVADEQGNAHLIFLPDEHTVFDSIDAIAAALSGGRTLPPGRYRLVPDGGEPTEVDVLGVHDVPDSGAYDQELSEGYGYITMRDGVKLSMMVRFPVEAMYGEGPWPTVIDYSGYTPSCPGVPEAGALLANLLGFAVVGVNMRGSGCSGGVFDVFSPAQAADGYDIVETVARQPWVLHGRPGMVGLSYPGISQLYVAATQPPSLSAITPLSVIDDLWHQQWPGGIYNSGFTRAWLAMRDQAVAQGGQAWDQARIDEGDEIARENQRVRSQNLDFERFGRAIDTFRPSLEPRRISTLVDRINVPVYLTGAWQDEQTGSRFATMLERFTSSPVFRATVFNGHHPDGYSPMLIVRWFEFLSFFVAKRVPKVNELVRMFAPAQFAEVFGFSPELEADRFAEFGDDYDAALAQYLTEDPIRILFDNGAGNEVLTATAHRHEIHTTSFPPPGTVARSWYLAGDGRLTDTADATDGADRYVDDPEAGELAYSMELLSDLNRFILPDVPIAWTRFADEAAARYETDPLTDPLIIAGSGHLVLWIRPGTADTAVQVTLTEIRSDGHEQRVQSGWHRLLHRREDPTLSGDLRVEYTFTPEDRDALVPGEWMRTRVPIHPFAHVFRAGSQLRISISTPGRDHPFWCFEAPVEAGASHDVGHGGAHASALVLPLWPVDLAHPEDYPPAGSLRGQPARDALPIRNTAAG
ncbi:MAG TPA: CocE/NonD family hydrolase [Microthrixaceae bacterium]|nr:CocE/NonD family hydrolase [Microthrixaceae bacterium]